MPTHDAEALAAAVARLAAVEHQRQQHRRPRDRVAMADNATLIERHNFLSLIEIDFCILHKNHAHGRLHRIRFRLDG